MKGDRAPGRRRQERDEKIWRKVSINKYVWKSHDETHHFVCQLYKMFKIFKYLFTSYSPQTDYGTTQNEF